MANDYSNLFKQIYRAAPITPTPNPAPGMLEVSTIGSIYKKWIGQCKTARVKPNYTTFANSEGVSDALLARLIRWEKAGWVEIYENELGEVTP